MTPLSAQTLAMAIQAVDAEIRRFKDAVGGDLAELLQVLGGHVLVVERDGVAAVGGCASRCR